MYLKELTINGFKSFAKKSELEFPTPIAAIVGPNGSGKSNVAESFRFVLGEQSVKSMRGKRGEDLIWGGSDAVTRGNRASVEVVFDNTTRAIDLDFDEVRIERIVHRDGQNEYKINNSAVRLKDVHELLAKAHIGATGHHIISQGEADRVISASTRERREMIEDALGLKVYQLKKQEAERKLQKTEVNIAQTESLRREAAPHLKYLKKQVERAERSIQVQQELKVAYAEYLKREDTYVAKRTDLLHADRKGPENQLASVVSEIAALKTQLDSVQEHKDTSAVDSAEAKLRSEQQVLRESERTLSTLEGQVRFLESRLQRQVAPAAADKMVSLATLRTLVSSIKSAIEKVLVSKDAGEMESALGSTLSSLEAFLDNEKTVTVDTSETDKAELEELRSQLPALESARAAATEAEAAARAALATAHEAVVSENKQHLEAERTLFERLNSERELRQSLLTINTELQALERDRTDFKQELQEGVTLIGRGVMDYFSYTVTDSAGTNLTEGDIAQEPREKQFERRRVLEKLKIRLEELGVGSTDGLMKEYKDAQERDEFLAKELEDLTSSVGNLQSLIVDMDAQLQEQFMAGIEKISTEFNRFFTLMFGGGSATLNRVEVKSRGDEDEDENVVVNEGVELSVSLPNKRIKGLEMLSGGERALTSIALIFAMSQVNPPPFIILDETDAALDEANSRRYGDMIEALAEKSQLVLITHNRETMSRAGILYGITMGGDGVSKILSVKFDEAAENAK